MQTGNLAMKKNECSLICAFEGLIKPGKTAGHVSEILLLGGLRVRRGIYATAQKKSSHC